jgi:hypothetical protein
VSGELSGGREVKSKAGGAMGGGARYGVLIQVPLLHNDISRITHYEDGIGTVTLREVDAADEAISTSIVGAE